MTVSHCMFDFDGTLVDSLGDILKCLTSAFAKCGVPVESLHVATVMQLQLKEAIASISPQSNAAQIAAVVAEFRNLYDASDYPATKLMTGVTVLLPELKARSIGMSIVSNKRHFPTLRILDKFGLRSCFDAVYNHDMDPGKPVMSKSTMIARAIAEQGLSRETTLYIGDSEVDVLAAGENGLTSVIVESGYGDIENFKRRPDYIVKELSEILAIDGLIRQTLQK
jgi:phosphoglycolate phosphatase